MEKEPKGEGNMIKIGDKVFTKNEGFGKVVEIDNERKTTIIINCYSGAEYIIDSDKVFEINEEIKC